MFLFSFSFNDAATPEIYTLSLHDALPIFGASFLEHRQVAMLLVLKQSRVSAMVLAWACSSRLLRWRAICLLASDRKSTRLNSSHVEISYAVFCLKKKK